MVGKEQTLLRQKANRQSPRPAVMEEDRDLLKRKKRKRNEKLKAKPRVKA